MSSDEVIETNGDDASKKESASSSSSKKPPPAPAPPQPIAEAASSSHNTEDEMNEIWFQEEERWELTWPIWHMLSRNDRRNLAHKHGCKTIGEFEEYMTLQRAVGVSSSVQEPYNSELLYANDKNDERKAKASQRTQEAESSDDVVDRKPAAAAAAVGKDDDDECDSSNDQLLEEEIESEQIAAADKLPTNELLAVGGKILILPDEMLHRVFEWLPVDAYGTLALVSPHWKSFTRTEAVYKRLCERLYLNQSKRRTLHVSRFGNSYRTMLEKRPRVRAGGGVYVMKYTKVKPIQRDMWTEIPVGAVLESVYYRYLYFQEDGRVLYALTPTGPHEMFRRFLKVCLTREEDPVCVWGKYQVSGREVTATARQPWQYVKLKMTIQPINLHGRYGYLSFDRHVTSSRADFSEWDATTVEFEVPDEPFRFIKDRRL